MVAIYAISAYIDRKDSVLKFATYEEIYSLWDRGFKQHEIAKLLKLDRHTVSKAIVELKTKHPELFPVVLEGKPKILQYNPLMDNEIKETF
ncbi:hypothetical protein LCGC14_0375940 [marine sediment metagenome]|uniref:Uncharacterized protein n=1 Tax=marine sediment metagenome TaxID=412755 RepID=A0A0F9VQZ9_9ZZZZ